MIEQIYDRVTNKANVGSKDKRTTRVGCVWVENPQDKTRESNKSTGITCALMSINVNVPD